MLKGYGLDRQSNTKLDTTSCSIAQKWQKIRGHFVHKVYGKRIGDLDPKNPFRRNEICFAEDNHDYMSNMCDRNSQIQTLIKQLLVKY